MIWMGHIARIEKSYRNAYTVLIGKPRRKRNRTAHRQDNIKLLQGRLGFNWLMIRAKCRLL
jgi:hypothetical protein